MLSRGYDGRLGLGENMIQKISLQNVQKHSFLEFELSPRITCVLGDNGSGKTTIMRAVKWCTQNRPAVTKMLKRGQDCVDVQIITDRGRITRYNSSSANGLILDIDGHVTTFERLGTTTPEKIKDVLNLSDINFQHSGDRHFFVNKTESERYNYLMEALGIDDLTEIVKKLNEKIRELQKREGTISESTARLNALHEEAEKFKKIPEMKNNLMERIAEEKKLEDTLHELQRMLNGVRKLRDAVVELTGLHELDEIKTTIDALRELFNNQMRYYNLYAQGMELVAGLERGTEERKAVLAEYIELLEELRTCPVCDHEITDELIDDLSRDNDYLDFPEREKDEAVVE